MGMRSQVDVQQNGKYGYQIFHMSVSSMGKRNKPRFGSTLRFLKGSNQSVWQ